MKFFKFLVKLNLRYSDSKQETEYVQTKIPIVKNFLTYLIIGIMALLIPFTIHFFLIAPHLTSGYMAISMLIIAILLFFGRNIMGKWLEYVVVGYLLCIVTLVAFSLSNVLFTLKICESFYAGYAFALFNRILGYRIVNMYSMVLFHVISLSLRLVTLYKHDLSITFMVTGLEFITVCFSLKSEIGERNLFDSVYKSKEQLLKFKDFLTEHLPDQMIIVSKDNSCTHFMNDSFKKTFDCEHISEAQKALHKLILVKDSLPNGSALLEKCRGLPNFQDGSVDLSQIINLFSNFKKSQKSISLQVCEPDLQGNPVTPRIESNRDSCEEERRLNSEGKRLEEENIFTTRSSKIEPGVYKTIRNQEMLETVLKSQRGLKSEKELTREEEKTKRTFKVKIFMLPWDGAEAIAIVFDDITQQKTIIELQVADKNKDLVIAMVSHELRTPLNGMLGLIDIVKKKIGDNEATAYLNACKNSGAFLLNLVNSILDLSQIKNNKLKLVYTKVCLLELLEEIKSIFEPFCSTKGLYLNILIGNDVPKMIITDRNRLSQILINLLGNAFKFTFEGGVTIKVETHQNNPSKLLFSVQDTGLGIKKEDQEKLFKLFGKLEQQDKNVNTNGVGLGLTISNTLAMLLNPSENQGICVESELRKGSSFSFLIETEVGYASEDKISGEPTSILETTFSGPPEDELFPLSSKFLRYQAFKFNKRMMTLQKSLNIENDDIISTDHSAKSKKHPKVSVSFMPTLKPIIQRNSEATSWCLIVDDNPFNIMVARHIMQEKTYEIKTALNGKEAIEEIKKHYDSGKIFNVVLMDCQMPVMDGYEATRILKAMMKRGQIDEFPIIALTANNRDEEHERLCQEVGMCGVVSKPLQIGELECVLKKLKKKK